MSSRRTYRLTPPAGAARRRRASGRGASGPAAPGVPTVSELVGTLGALVRGEVGRTRVRGEISNLRVPASGHTYFTLKDDRAQLPAVLFRGAAARQRVQPREGMEVVVTGEVTVYEPQGKLQILVERLEAAGEGALRAAFEALRQRLAAEGLFDADRKRPLPRLPRRVGVVTSPTGAALRDFLRVLDRRAPQVHVLIAPVRVQGEGAAEGIARALARLDRAGCEVLVVTRGGGSLEDLWAFNEEVVVRAIAACETPVISAVGHEVDVTLSDLVADLRAATPSAAAERVAPERDALKAELDGLRRRAMGTIRADLSAQRRRLLEARTRLPDPRHLLATARQHLDEAETRARVAAERSVRAGAQRLRTLEAALVRLHPQRRLRGRREVLERLDRRLFAAGPVRAIPAHRAHLDHLASALRERETRALTAARAHLSRAHASLEALSPLAVLGRGYAIVTDEAGQILRAAAQAPAGTRVRVRLDRGALRARVEAQEDEATDPAPS